MAEDTISFEAAHPVDAAGESFEGITLERWSNGAPIRRRVLHNVLGRGHTLHYLGPGGQRFSARIRLEEANFDDLQDAIDDILFFEQAVGTVTIEPGVEDARQTRRAEEHENMLIDSIVQAQDIIAGRDVYAHILTLNFIKLQIIGNIG